MTQTTAITEIIQTLADVESRFNITRTESEGFFPEWYADLPEITEVDKAALNLIRRRYLYHLNDGSLTAHIPHPQLAHTRIEGVKVNHPRPSLSKNTQ